MKFSKAITLFASIEAFTWLGIQNQESFSCESTSLGRVQKRLCSRHEKFAPAIKAAAAQSIKLCQERMSGERWGCAGVQKLPHLPRGLKKSTSESAFLHGLSSGQLIASLYRLCQSGTIKCEPNEVVKFAQQFTNVASLAKKKSVKDVELHNAKVGRALAWSSKNKICKCHGQSGSCSMKTCWETAPQAGAISHQALEKYSKSVKVNVDNFDAAIPTELKRTIARNRFLHLEEADDFCKITSGRICQISDPTKSSFCDSLCCGRGEIKKEKIIVKNECSYVWPDQVKCTPRANKQISYICK